MEKRIITNRKVAATFNREECYLMRTIVSSNSDRYGNARYVVDTDEVTWVDSEEPMYDAQGVQVMKQDEPETPETQTRRTLRIIGKRQKGGILQASKATSDGLYALIKDSLPAVGDSFFDYQQLVEQQALLVETKMKMPYLTEAEDWEALTESNFIVTEE